MVFISFIYPTKVFPNKVEPKIIFQLLVGGAAFYLDLN